MKVMNQWYFKITDYKQRLIDNLDKIDYPTSTINAQRMWLENLHDWCVSRQRKWGCPIPIEGEEDTMDTFVCSSYYLIRYCDPDNENELCSKDKYKQVDIYVGGNEHATGHLIFARFINMFLYDIGVVPCEEPVKRFFSQGVILYNGEKMSKSKGNTINPDDYDQDELRFFLMQLGPYSDGGSWNDKAINGIKRFINRFKEWMSREGEDVIDVETFRIKIFELTEKMKFNKVVSEFFILLNSNRTKNLKPEIKEELISILEIYMPGLRDKL
jgi:leucyl-tRNA synthetase